MQKAETAPRFSDRPPVTVLMPLHLFRSDSAASLPSSASFLPFSSSGCGHLLLYQCFRLPTAGICCFLNVFVIRLRASAVFSLLLSLCASFCCSFRFRTVSVATLLFSPFLCRFHAVCHCFPVISPPRFFVLPQTLPLTRFAFLPLLPALHSCRALKAVCFRDRKRLSRTDSERGVRGESLIFSDFTEPGHRDRCLRAFFSGH